MSRELEDLLRAARETLPEPDDEVGHRARARVLASVTRRRSRRWTLLAFAVAIGVASAAGFGFGHRFGPEQVQAARPGGVSGAGFFPAAGWSTFQRGGRSLAANVAIDANDLAREGALPVATLRALPRDGTVIVAALRPARLVANVRQPLPLRLADAQTRLQRVGGRRLLVHRLSAAVEAYVVDVSVFFGTRTPAPALREQAQRQLDRLVVAAPQVTIRVDYRVNPAAPFRPWVDISGTIASAAAGQVVEVLARDCGPRGRFYRVVGSARSAAGGSWALQTLRDGAPISGIPVNAFFRAQWNGAQSEPVLVRVPIFVNAFWWNRRQRIVGVLVVTRETGQNVRRRFVELQRRVPGTDTWVRVRRARLGRPPRGFFTGGDSYWTTFKLRTRSLTLRAFVPDATAAPCYRATASGPVRR